MNPTANSRDQIDVAVVDLRVTAAAIPAAGITPHRFDAASATPTVPERIIDLRESPGRRLGAPSAPSIIGERFVIDSTHDAQVFGADDAIARSIIELEVQQLVDLGDCEGEARDWLNEQRGAAWICLFEQNAARSAGRTSSGSFG